MVSEDFSNTGDGARSGLIRFDQFVTLILLDVFINLENQQAGQINPALTSLTSSRGISSINRDVA